MRSLLELLGPLPNEYLVLRHLDELYGSGSWDENATLAHDVDLHMASSIESLQRLYRREKHFIEKLGLKNENIGESIRKVRNTLEHGLDSPGFPSNKDDFIAASAVGLYRIQSVYHIPMINFVHGQLRPHLAVSAHNLSWWDCLHIGDAAREKSDLSTAVEWVKVAHEVASKDPEADKSLVNKILEASIKLHDDTAIKSGKVTKYSTQDIAVTRIDPYNPTVAKKYKSKIKMWHKTFRELKKKFPMFKNEPKDNSVFFEQVTYKERLDEQCQMLEDSQYIINNNTLKCHNLHRNLANLRLGPVKFELLSDHPVVATFHDFVTEAACDELQRKGRGKMKATPLTIPKSSRDTAPSAYTDRRTSKIKYISHREDSLAFKLNRKISDALNFDLNGDHVPAENYQLMNYGIGGFIELHIDSNSPTDEKDIDYEKKSNWLTKTERLMTFMVYLSNVTEGGNTVFPNLGLTIPPVKGSALFWHTINTGGNMDVRMKHMGCPVVQGDKWIANKWVKWVHHMFEYPCSRFDKEESFYHVQL